MRKFINVTNDLYPLCESQKSEEILTKLKTEDPSSLEFAQSLGIPPAVIEKFSDLGKYEDQIESNPQAAKLFHEVEQQLESFIDKILGAPVSRRQVFKGTMNFIVLVNNLNTISKLLKQPEKQAPIQPQPQLDQKTVWLTDEEVLEYIPTEHMENEWMELLSDYHDPYPEGDDKKIYLKVANEFVNDFGLKFRFLDVDLSQDQYRWLVEFDSQKRSIPKTSQPEPILNYNNIISQTLSFNFDAELSVGDPKSFGEYVEDANIEKILELPAGTVFRIDAEYGWFLSFVNKAGKVTKVVWTSGEEQIYDIMHWWTDFFKSLGGE